MERKCSRCGNFFFTENSEKRKKIIEIKVEKKGNGNFTFTKIKKINSLCNKCLNE